MGHWVNKITYGTTPNFKTGAPEVTLLIEVTADTDNPSSADEMILYAKELTKEYGAKYAPVQTPAPLPTPPAARPNGAANGGGSRPPAQSRGGGGGRNYGPPGGAAFFRTARFRLFGKGLWDMKAELEQQGYHYFKKNDGGDACWYGNTEPYIDGYDVSSHIDPNWHPINPNSGSGESPATSNGEAATFDDDDIPF